MLQIDQTESPSQSVLGQLGQNAGTLKQII